MKIKFESAVFFVKDIEISKRFYTEVLEQEILMDFGRNVGFQHFSIWEESLALDMIYSDEAKSVKVGRNNAELYFESVEIENIVEKVKKKGVNLIQPIHEQPWGQRAFRFYDPDNLIIEIAEPMSEVVKRLHKIGLNPEEINKKSQMPINFINEIIKKAD